MLAKLERLIGEIGDLNTRGQAIGRIGLPAVREHRRKRLQQEHDARMAALDDMEASVPDLNAVMMVRVSGDVMPGGQVG